MDQNFDEIYPLAQKISRFVGEAIRDYNMIRPYDRIMIGLSGGKDSLVLSLALALLKKRSPVKFDLGAVLIDQSGGAMNIAGILEYMEILGIQLDIIEHPTYKIITERDERSPCSFCANMRRGILARHAKENGFCSLALGHHKDDAVETVMLNLLYAGRFKCYRPNLYMNKTGISVIRPLVYVEERNLALEAGRLGLPVAASCCPYKDESKRKLVKELLSNVESEVPEIKSNIIHALKSIRAEDTWLK